MLIYFPKIRKYIINSCSTCKSKFGFITVKPFVHVWVRLYETALSNKRYVCSRRVMYSGCEVVDEFGVISTKKLLPLQMRVIHPCFKNQHQYFWSGVTTSHRFLIFNRFITKQKVEVWVNSVICNSVITQGTLSLCLLLQEHVCECRSNAAYD